MDSPRLVYSSHGDGYETMSKQRVCSICKTRPPWQDKNCPPGICKKCFHRHIWVDRPAARQRRQMQAAVDTQHSLALDDDALAFDDVSELVDDLAGDDEALVEWLTGSELAPPGFL